MTTKEAIQAMLDGKKVFLPCWNDGSQYIHFENSAFREETGEIYVFGANYTDWEIYEEPKQVVTIERWLVEDRFGIRSVVELHYHDVACYFHEYQMNGIKLLSKYEVEL